MSAVGKLIEIYEEILSFRGDDDEVSVASSDGDDNNDCDGPDHDQDHDNSSSADGDDNDNSSGADADDNDNCDGPDHDQDHDNSGSADADDNDNDCDEPDHDQDLDNSSSGDGYKTAPTSAPTTHGIKRQHDGPSTAPTRIVKRRYSRSPQAETAATASAPSTLPLALRRGRRPAPFPIISPLYETFEL